jgi:glucose-6-phosphate 1-epimerase
VSASIERLEDPARLRLATPAGGTVEVRLHGAQVTAWQPPEGDEVIYLSPRSSFTPGASIRGGIPIIFPQFADLGPLPKHGFARNAEWEVAMQTAEGGSTEATLVLRDDAATRAVWDHAFLAEVAVRLDAALRVTLTIENLGSTPFGFTAALHGYLRVGDVEQATVHGVEGTRYLDKVLGGEHTESAAVPALGEIDRVYLDAPAAVELHDLAHQRVLRLERGGFPDVVVWNPGEEKGTALADLGGDEWRRFVCVEAAAVGTPVSLAPGERWSAWQRISVDLVGVHDQGRR